MCVGRRFVVVAGARRRDEGPVAGAAFEIEPVPQDAGDFEAWAQREFGDLDREELVVVPLPGHPGVEEDVVVDDRQAKAGRFSVLRNQVVDIDLGEGQ